MTRTFDGPASAHGVLPQISVVFQGEAPRRAQVMLPGVAVRPYELPAEARSERHFSAGPEERRGAADAQWGDGIYLGTFLIVSLVETADGMTLVARGVFDRAAGRRLLEDLQRLLGDVVTDPARQLAEWISTPPSDPDLIQRLPVAGLLHQRVVSIQAGR